MTFGGMDARAELRMHESRRPDDDAIHARWRRVAFVELTSQIASVLRDLTRFDCILMALLSRYCSGPSGRRTRDREIASSTPGRHIAR